jgi:CBS-domain-containing membrane protein
MRRWSLKPIEGADHPERKHLTLREEAMLALLPTVVVLGVMGMVESFSRQRLLFASLGASAFLIYLDPGHGTNSARTLILSQMVSAIIGYLAFSTLGPNYLSMASAMILTIILMIMLDAVHPPAIPTTLSFAYNSGPIKNLLFFGLAVGLILLLVYVQKATLTALARRAHHRRAGEEETRTS